MWYTNLENVNEMFATDASLSACGAVCGGEFLRYRFPDKLLLDVKYNIAHLEMSSESDTIAECLGTLFNTLSMTISVLPDQMLELRILLESLTCKQKETRKELES